MKKPYDLNRKLFFDYHMSASIREILDGYDAKTWAQTLADAGVDAISLFMKCGYGYSYYQGGEYGRKHPFLRERDLVRDTIRECRKRNIRVIGYYNAWVSEYDLLNHPENCRTGKDGSAVSRELCPNNPIFEDQILPHVTEICKTFDIDALFFDCVFMEKGRVCYCEHCRAQFKRDTGIDEIPVTAEDNAHDRYVAWSLDRYEQFRVRLAQAVHRGNPNVAASMNWGYTARCPQEPPADMDFLSQDCWPTNILAAMQVQAKHWAFSGKSFSLMNNMSLQWWGSYEIKPYETLVQECMVPLINGGHPWLGFQMFQDHTVDPAVMKTAKQVFSYIKNVEWVFENKEPLPYVGVLFDESQQRNRRIEGVHEVDVDLTSLFGLNKQLVSCGIPYHAMNESRLIAQLDRLALVILSNDQYVSPLLFSHLRRYVNEGGKLLITGKSGSVDPDGTLIRNRDFEELTGVSLTGRYDAHYAYIAPTLLSAGRITPRAILSADPFMKVEPKGAQVLAHVTLPYAKTAPIQWGDFPAFSNPWHRTEDAAVCLNTVGKGKVCYVCTDVFRGYAGTNNHILKGLIRNLICDVLIRDGLRVSNSTYLEVTLMQDKTDGSLLINLLNCARSVPMREIEPRTENAICEQILPIRDTEISFAAPHRPSSVRTVVSGESLPFTYTDGRVRLCVPCVEIYEGVQIAFEPHQ